MPCELLILADDLSGAADCAAGFARVGSSSAVLLDAQSATEPVAVLTVDTDSRRDDGQAAGAKVLAAWQRHGQGRRVFKKIDSTLRGSWPAEVAALQPVLGMALVAPAFPELGRVLQDGVLRVRGVPLADTATWRLEHAGRESRPLSMLHAAGLRCLPVPAALLSGPPADLAAAIGQARADGVQALVFDTLDAAHLDALAAATWSQPGLFWVGSAGLSRALAQYAAAERPSQGGRGAVEAAAPAPAGSGVLTVIGSLSPIATEQIACLEAAPGTRVHRLSAATLLARTPAMADCPHAAAVRRTLAEGLDPVLCIAADDPADPADGPLLARALAELLADCLQQAAGVVLTGGETARAMLARIGVDRLEILGESEPGVVISQTTGEARPRFVATKAGAFGDAASLDRARLDIKSRIAASHGGGPAIRMFFHTDTTTP